VYLLWSHSGESKVGFINVILHGVLYTVLPLTDPIINANNTSWGHASYIIPIFRKLKGYL